MKLKTIMAVLLCLAVLNTQARRPSPDRIQTDSGAITIQPVRHGTLVLGWSGNTIYVDPVGGAEAFTGIDSPDVILITHIHGDHLSVDTLNALDTEGAVVVVPRSVADELPASYSNQVVVIGNGEQTGQSGILIRAVPMYNLPDDENSRHPKGWGNGYVLTLGGKNVYISGDTEDIPEMRSLENIDVAFVCMNLPYTMDVGQAASAVLDFEPDIVYPYHYRGQDTAEFRKLVTSRNNRIQVRLKEWYPEN